MAFRLLGSVLCLSVLSLTVYAFDFRRDGDTLTIRGKRTEIQLRQARIVSVKDMVSGVTLAGENSPAVSRTAGVGNMLGKVAEMRRLHIPWGEPYQSQALPADEPISLYRFPTPRSRVTVTPGDAMVTVRWQGLSNGGEDYPDDWIELVFCEADGGALAFRAKAETAGPGAFGLQVPIENLDGQGTLYLPTFGGMEYRAGGRPSINCYQSTSLFSEAKFIAYRLHGTSLALWSEDSEFRSYYTMVGRGERGCSFALEHHGLIPYERLRQVETSLMKLDTFAGEGWVAAARPYRDWYRRQFATEIARRDSHDWANRINAVMDYSEVPGDAVLERIKSLMPADRVLLQVWQARKEGFDKNLPDFTLRDSYLAGVKRAHKHGFRVMCYVNALCANYRSPVWDRDGLSSFFLTRPNNISNYNGDRNAMDELLVGTVTAVKDNDRFASVKPGRLLYGDPLSPGWREYYSSIMVRMNRESGTDANYQDTLGCTNDNGNGRIEGLSGAQGNQALAVRLAETMPDIPMASEFGQDSISMAIKWNLNAAQKWGKDTFREYRLHHQIPLSCFLFGTRPWIHMVAAETDFKKHVITGCSDALGGMGMFPPSLDMDVKTGFADHLVLRAKIFTERGLRPWFPEEDYPQNIRCLYRDDQGGLYQYYDDGRLQMMLDPDGKPLYGRIDHATSVQTKALKLPGWPASDADGIYGLNPDTHYALFPDGAPPELNLGRLPDGVSVRYYYSTPEYAYLELGGEGEFSRTIKVPERFRHVLVNDRPAEGGTISGKLPLRVFFSTGECFAGRRMLCVSDASGLQFGEAIPLPSPRKRHGKHALYSFQHFDSAVLDSLFLIQSEDDGCEVFFQNLQEKYGNGSLIAAFVNGRKVAEFDCYTKPEKKGMKGVFDTKLRKWVIPLGEYRGGIALVSIRVSQKGGGNSDLMLASVPCLVSSSVRKVETSFPEPIPQDHGETKFKPAVRPDGAPTQVLHPVLSGKTVMDGVFTPSGPGSSIVTSVAAYPVEHGRRVFLSGKLGFATEKRGTVRVGVMFYDAQGKAITGPRISRRPNTLTTLSHPAEAGSDKLMVIDASNWQEGGIPALGKELPATSLLPAVEGISKYGGDYGVFLKSPIKEPIASDTPIALHSPSNTYYYVPVGKLDVEPKEFLGELPIWPGAVKYRVILLSAVPVQFSELTLELFER